MPQPSDSKIEAFIQDLSSPVCDALVVFEHDALVVDWRSPRAPDLFDLRSVTKSVISVLLGRLEYAGLLSDADLLLGDIFDEWKQTTKAGITLRQLMAQTTGLDATAHSETVFASGDVVGFALDLDLVEEPGQRFAYNNAATNLLPEFVRRVTGAPFLDVVRELLFDPLEISDWDWKSDLAGNPLGMSGCRLSPRALADIGRLINGDGHWHGQRLLAADWRARSTTPIPPAAADDPHRTRLDYGLLWWLLYPADERFAIDEEVVGAWKSADPPLDEAVLERMSGLMGSGYSVEELLAAATDALLPLSSSGREGAIELWHDNTWRRGLPDARRAAGSAIGFYAEGDGGQMLVCRPGSGQVIVQLVGDEAAPASAQALSQAVAGLFSG
ncbi:serine hydrolase [Maricaulis sp.]|uniref:serine hydrolase domain-containing protein n=1 Tax=Maricaulis sp. TaxID=1486257 RepID=UPI0026172C71|nr:serine hydrolase [Maricaulis sp.]